MHTIRTRLRLAAPLVAIGLTIGLVSGCGGGTSATPATTTSTATAPTAGSPSTGKSIVLPVPSNPIANTATAPGLMISKALVENNVDPDTGKAAKDHLEVTLQNTGTTPLADIEVYYSISDPTRKVSEGYYAKLTGFSIAPGASRVAHFDDTGARDHYPVNTYSLYYTDKNELVVDVMASTPNVKPATFAVRKDAGGAEAGVE